ncbi:MAG: tripartite tricarboxylate transporter substrate binding protein [Betaproteobacteria bacterium]
MKKYNYLFLGLIFSLFGNVIWAQSANTSSSSSSVNQYPNRPVSLIVPFPAGGAADLIGRMVGSSLQTLWGQPVIIENRPGAGGMLGAELAAQEKGDPYVLFLGSIGIMSVNQSLYKSIKYDAARDFTPISMLVKTPSYLVINSTIPVNTAKEFVNYARNNPGKLTFGSAGNGTTEHTNAVMLARMANLDMIHVPYKGISPAMNDFLGGQINFIVEQGVAILPYIQAGKVKVLATTGMQRTAVLPDVPTLNETVAPGFDAFAWYALYAPAGISPTIQKQLNADVIKSFTSPTIKKRFIDMGAEVTVSTPTELAEFQKNETAKWGMIVKNSGIQPD